MDDQPSSTISHHHSAISGQSSVEASLGGAQARTKVSRTIIKGNKDSYTGASNLKQQIRNDNDTYWCIQNGRKVGCSLLSISTPRAYVVVNVCKTPTSHTPQFDLSIFMSKVMSKVLSGRRWTDMVTKLITGHIMQCIKPPCIIAMKPRF